jgi:hypothetical protein
MSRDLVEDVAARLEAGMPELKRVSGALELADLVKRNALPNATPAAFVVPGGASGEPRTNATGPAQQRLTERVKVLLFARANDAAGGTARDALDALRLAARDLLFGWSPDDREVEPFEVASEQIASLGGGAGLYDLTMRTRYRLRATT